MPIITRKGSENIQTNLVRFLYNIKRNKATVNLRGLRDPEAKRPEIYIFVHTSACIVNHNLSERVAFKIILGFYPNVRATDE